MPKIVVSEFLTLDGVMQAPGNPDEDRSGGFEHGGWQLAYFDDIFGGVMMEAFAATEVARLREGSGKEIQVIGSGELAQTLIRHDLVDSYRLMIHPLVIGTGKRLFREGTTLTRLRLVDSKPTTTGVLILNYEPERSTR